MTYKQAKQAISEGKQIFHEQVQGCFQMFLNGHVIDGYGNDKNKEFLQAEKLQDGWSLEAPKIDDDFLNDLK